jgi:hypothetical protein
VEDRALPHRASTSRYGIAGFTISMSAPSSASSRLPQRLAGVGRVHLVGAPVAELRRALGRLAEGAVEGGGVLHRVGEDRHLRVPALVQRPRMRATRPSIMSEGATMSAPASACETAIRPAASASRRCRPPPLDHAAVPVRGVLAEADVGDHQQLGQLGASAPAPPAAPRHRRRSPEVPSSSFAPGCRRGARRGSPARSASRASRAARPPRSAPLPASSRRGAHPLALGDEEGEDQVGGGHLRLPHQAPHTRGAAQAPRPV